MILKQSESSQTVHQRHQVHLRRQNSLYMRRLILFINVLLCLCTAQGQSAIFHCDLPSEPLPVKTRVVFVLDTSGSMVGYGDGRANIFKRVKATINHYVKEQQPNQVQLITFDTGIRSKKSFESPAGSAAWNNALAKLQATGKNTYLYRSIDAALRPLNSGQKYITTVFVLTDGMDNDPARPISLQKALSSFVNHGPLDRLHYVALGANIPKEARLALGASNYADGLRVLVNNVPDLSRSGLEGGVINVSNPDHIAVPFADGTKIILSVNKPGGKVVLASPIVSQGRIQLDVDDELPYGSLALLCAIDDKSVVGGVATKPRRILLRLHLLKASAPAMRWLNPSADRRLRLGENVVLRFHALKGIALGRASVKNIPSTLRAEIINLPNSREFAVRFTNLDMTAGALVNPMLVFENDPSFALPQIAATNGGKAPIPSAAIIQSSNKRQVNNFKTERFFNILLGLLLLGLLLFLGLRFTAKRAKIAAQTAMPTEAPVPNIQGLNYGEERTLSLVATDGNITNIPMPLGGQFDVGILARVPLLSGLRAEKQRDGLALVRIPDDLEVSQGGRILYAGDVVRPGTLMGVTIADSSRAPNPTIGSLAGLGLPLELHYKRGVLRVIGPYGDHGLNVSTELVDLGTAFKAPALNGLKVVSVGQYLMLVELPKRILLHRVGDPQPLRLGNQLPEITFVTLLDD